MLYRVLLKLYSSPAHAIRHFLEDKYHVTNVSLIFPCPAHLENVDSTTVLGKLTFVDNHGSLFEGGK